MLKRIYIDNFRCLVNFDLSLDPINLLLGPNGSGKSTVFEALRKIQRLIGGSVVGDVFKPTDLTRWQKSSMQRFNLEIEGNDGIYGYELLIAYEGEGQQARIYKEFLEFNGRTLLEFQESGDAYLYGDNFELGPVYPLDWNRSALASLPPRPENSKLTWFKKRISQIVIIQPNPPLMSAESGGEEKYLSEYMENFVSWYRFISQDQSKTTSINQALKEIWPDFDFFKFVEAGERHRVLKVRFSLGEKARRSIEYRFDELSDGQKALIALYTLIYHARSEEYTLMIDEPENYLALPEIQPLLTMIYDLCIDKQLQTLLISHHPEPINYLAASAGIWFQPRYYNAPTWTKRVKMNGDGGLTIAELVARGWLDG
jgi:predicted ATPase